MACFSVLKLYKSKSFPSLIFKRSYILRIQEHCKINNFLKYMFQVKNSKICQLQGRVKLMHFSTNEKLFGHTKLTSFTFCMFSLLKSVRFPLVFIKGTRISLKAVRKRFISFSDLSLPFPKRFRIKIPSRPARPFAFLSNL